MLPSPLEKFELDAKSRHTELRFSFSKSITVLFFTQTPFSLSTIVVFLNPQPAGISVPLPNLIPTFLQKMDAGPDEADSHNNKQNDEVRIPAIKVKTKPTNAEEQPNSPKCGIELFLSQPDNLNNDQTQS